MNDEAQFLDAMFSAPEDMSIRARYAVYLDDFAPCHAEFIRLEVEFASRKRQRGDAAKKRRARELHLTNRTSWDCRVYKILKTTPLGLEFGKYSHSRKRPLTGWLYSRGCIETLVMPAWAIKPFLGSCFSAGPVRKLIVRSKTETSRADQVGVMLDKVEELKHIEHLVLYGTYGAPNQWIEFLKIPSIQGLRNLTLPAITLSCGGNHRKASGKMKEFVRLAFEAHPNLEILESHRSRGRESFSRRKFSKGGE